MAEKQVEHHGVPQGNGLGESSAPAIPDFVPEGDQAILRHQVGFWVDDACIMCDRYTLNCRMHHGQLAYLASCTTCLCHTLHHNCKHPTPTLLQFQQQDDALDLISAALDHVQAQSAEWNVILSEQVGRLERIETNADETDMRFKNLNKTMKKA